MAPVATQPEAKAFFETIWKNEWRGRKNFLKYFSKFFFHFVLWFVMITDWHSYPVHRQVQQISQFTFRYPLYKSVSGKAKRFITMFSILWIINYQVKDWRKWYKIKYLYFEHNSWEWTWISCEWKILMCQLKCQIGGTIEMGGCSKSVKIAPEGVDASQEVFEIVILQSLDF